MEEYKVYIKVLNDYITEINSSAFLNDTSGWVEIDSGEGDRYHHAQGNYLNGFLYDDYGRNNYKYINGAVYEIPEEEKPEVEEDKKPTAEERIAELEAALNALLEGATE
jgi:hypothetical protein